MGERSISSSADVARNVGQYQFTAEELRVLNQCNRESFFQRSLPLSSMLGLGTYAAVQAGRLRPNPYWGALPKVAGAVVIGYFLGKLSYQNACAEKLMALPDSYIGQLLRNRRDGKVDQGNQPSTGLTPSESILGAVKPGDVYSDAGSGPALVLDLDKPLFSDDKYRPVFTEDRFRPDDRRPDDSTPFEREEDTPPAPALSYDDLRRQNRGELDTNKQNPYRVVDVERTRQPARPPPPSTNRYGDSLE